MDSYRAIQPIQFIVSATASRLVHPWAAKCIDRARSDTLIYRPGGSQLLAFTRE
jgi:hypothetical protein